MRVLIPPILVLVLALACCGPKESIVIRSEEGNPVDCALATYEADFPFPLSAYNIHYFLYSNGAKLSEFYRFDIGFNQQGKLETPFQAILPILEQHAQLKGGQTDFTPKPFNEFSEQTPEIPQPEARFLPMSWWNPHELKRGYILGEYKAKEIFVLVDEENSRVYYHYFNE